VVTVSNVLQPRGPLPARVYWTRRLLLLLAVGTMVSVAWVVLAPGGDGRETTGALSTSQETSDESPFTPPAITTQPTTQDREDSGDSGDRGGADSEVPPGEHTGRGQSGQQGDPGKRRGGPTPSPGGPTTSSPAPLAQPTGPCEPAEIALAIDVEDSAAGEPNPATLRLTSLAASACTLGITPDSLEIRVTSGADVIWSSTDCPARLPARQVVARADPPATYVFTWSGHRSTEGCGAPGEVPASGGYWVEAGLIGGEPTAAYFDVT
jgi:hypothetical protein